MRVEHGRGWIIEGALSPAQEQALLETSDRPVAGSVVWKFGSRSFVGSCPVADTRLALKYYYPLSLGRQLGYTLLGTRAMRSWIAARGLRFLGVPTPEPVAVVELKRFGFLAHRALFATRICDGLPLPEFLDRHLGDHAQLNAVARGCREIFEVFAKFRICHGDTYAKNFIVGPDRAVSVIDLDALTFLTSPRAWQSKRSAELLDFSRAWNRHADSARAFTDVFGAMQREHEPG